MMTEVQMRASPNTYKMPAFRTLQTSVDGLGAPMLCSSLQNLDRPARYHIDLGFSPAFHLSRQLDCLMKKDHFLNANWVLDFGHVPSFP